MSLKRVLTQDKDLQAIQDNADQALTPIQRSIFVGGNLLVGISLISGQDNLVSHKLNRALQIWVPSRLTANAAIWELSTTASGATVDTTRYVNLGCSANCTITLWVG